MKLSRAPILLTAALSLAASTLLAQSPAHDVDAVTPSAALQVPQTGSVEVLSGGVGAQEQRTLKAMQGQYPLHVVFSTQGGNYAVADRLEVRGQDGQPVASLNQAGPQVLLKLPQGRYDLAAEFDGRREVRQIEVAAAPRTVQWRQEGPSTR